MTDSASEAEILARLVPELQAEGYDVFINPRPSLLPAFLKDYVPDAVALGSKKNLAIEITGQQHPSASKKLARVANLFQGQQKWELRVILATPVNAQNELHVQTSQRIRDSVAEILALSKNEYYRAALLLCWATLEALARVIIERRFERPQTPGRLVQILASDGYLTPSEADRLRTLAEKRNKLIHGEIDTTATPEEISFFIGVLDTLLSMTSQ